MKPKLVLWHLWFICYSCICLTFPGVNSQFQYFKDVVNSWSPYKYYTPKQQYSESEQPHFVNVNLNQFQPPPGWPPSPASIPNWGPSPVPAIPKVQNTDSNGLVRPCKDPSTLGQLFNASITPCEGEGYCTLQRGTNSTLEFNFISNVPTKALFGKLSGLFGWFELSFGKSEDLCMYPGIVCPIQPGMVYKVVRVIEVRRNFPSLEIDTKIQVYGDDDFEGDIGCAIVPVKIK